jgi:hypothetical protein
MARIMIHCHTKKERSMMNVRVAVAVWIVSVVLLSGCASDRAAGKTKADSPRTTEEITGEVLDVLNTGRYKYVRVKTEDEKIWCATTRCSVKVGDDVTVPPGFMMTGLKSLVLKRTFDEVYFVNAIGAEAEAMLAKSPKRPAGHPQTGAKPAGHPKTGGTQAGQSKNNERPPLTGKTFTGTVAEVIHASRYTYIRIEDGEKTVWAAAPQFKVKSGDKATAPLVMPMKDFKSTRLKRTFDMVYFTSRIDVVPASKK